MDEDLRRQAQEWFTLEERYLPGPPVDYPREHVAADLSAASDLLSIFRERAGPPAGA